MKFRFKFVADGIYNFDGIGLDNFRLQDPFPNDLGVYELLSPVSGPDLTASEAITVNVRNYGTLPQSGFNVSYKADGGPVITEIFTGTLAAGTMAPYTFATNADLSVDGFHDICSWTSLPEMKTLLMIQYLVVRQFTTSLQCQEQALIIFIVALWVTNRVI